ncbi:MAG TPA: metal-dependent transcriptional regulator, partial [Phnomibacter sp.]|nr:metal-dependent transcriptional regulator [Phnomibacter sp.]
MYSVAEENYIKSIFHLQKAGRNVSTNQLAEKLQTRPASVTDMLKKLQLKKLLTYEPYYGVKLTPKGNKLALGIIRRHRLWEYFLVNNLQFGWEEVHAIAEQLEHVQSDLLIERLDNYLEHPRFDPHGDPIPDNQGNLHPQHQTPLHEFALNQACEICAVGQQDQDLLEMLGSRNLHMGTSLTVLKRYGFDRSLEVRLANGQTVAISETLAKAIFVKPK